MIQLLASAVLLLCLSGLVYAKEANRITVSLPTNGTEVRTPVLEAYRNFRVTIRSPFDLRLLWDKGRPAYYALMFDGQLVPDKYRVTPWDYDHDMTELTFAFRGRGDPLVVRLDQDLSALIRHATLEVVPTPVPSPSAPKVPATEPTPAVAPRETTTGDGVLERAVFELPTNGSQIQTALPLQLHRSYDIRLRAPHNLGLLCGKPRPEWFGLQLSSTFRQRKSIPACQVARDVEEIVLPYTGRGVPLVLQMAKDVSEVLPQVTVEISPTPEPVPMPASRIPAPLLWLAAGAGVVICWRLIVIARRTFRHEPIPWEVEPSSPVVSQLALPSSNVELHEAREELARARQDAQHARREAAYAKQVTAQFRREQDEVRRRAKVLAHWAELERNFLNPDYQQNYAAKHLRRVLDREKDAWFQEAKAVRDDEALRSLLEQEYPQVLQVLEARLEVIRIAERLDVEPARKPTFTPEERQRKVANFRSRLLQWRQTKAEDFMAQRMQQLELLRAFEEDLAQYDLDEDERERLLQEFRQELDLFEPPKPKGQKPHDDEEHGHEGFATTRPDR